MKEYEEEEGAKMTDEEKEGKKEEKRVDQR